MTTYRVARAQSARLPHRRRSGGGGHRRHPLGPDSPGGRWQRSETEPLREPEPFWGDDPVRNARLLGSGRVGGRPVSIVSFFDPRLPAWFELWVEQGTSRLLALRMTAQAHFMRHRYSGFDAPLQNRPPR